jgi:hypothetical protein
MTEQDPKVSTPEVTAPQPKTPQLTEEDLSKATGGAVEIFLKLDNIPGE